MLNRVELLETPWTVACQAPLFIKFSRQEYWSGLTFPTQGNLPDPGMESTFPTSLALAGNSLPLSHLGSLEVHERKRVSCSVMSNSLWLHGLQPTRLFQPCNFPGKNTSVGCHFLLQGIFLTQGLNLGLLHCSHIFYSLSHQGNSKKKTE